LAVKSQKIARGTIETKSKSNPFKQRAPMFFHKMDSEESSEVLASARGAPQLGHLFVVAVSFNCSIALVV